MDWHPLDILFFTSGLLIVCYVYGKLIYLYFKGTDVKYVEPPFVYLGNNIKVFLGFEHLQQFIKRMYNSFPEERYIGLFELQKPVIMIKDLELIKQIGIKEFDSFHDHRMFLINDSDIFAKSLFGLKGKEWRDMRAILSPAFSGVKMRNMFEFVNECSKRTSEFYFKKIQNEDCKAIEIEVRDMITKYTLDTIASSAYGIEINSLKDKNNDFQKYGKRVSNLSLSQIMKLLLCGLMPKITKYIKLEFISKDVSSFFRNIVQNTIEYRETNNIIRQDLIHLLMEARKGSLVHENNSEYVKETGFSTVEESSIGKEIVQKNLSDDDLTAQALVFFIGGYDTTTNALSFLFYEIGQNINVQKKLHTEIDEFVDKENILTYNNLHKLKYLDMVVSETLRKWPPAAFLDRVCSKSFTLPPPNESSNQSYTIRPNDVVWIPVYGIHHDPQYFPKPEKFDPERFSDENKISINPTSYLPFGIGPRNCIGSRYALMAIKAMAFNMLRRFDIVITDKTETPLKLLNSIFTLQSKNGIWVELKPRVFKNKLH